MKGWRKGDSGNSGLGFPEAEGKDVTEEGISRKYGRVHVTEGESRTAGRHNRKHV